MSSRHREVSDEVRADQFARYLGAVVGELTSRPDWTVSRIIKESGVSRETFYRWRRADWAASGKPKADKVREFHTQLGLDPSRALSILGLNVAPVSEDPLSLADPDIQEYMLSILRRLRDPAETDEERYFIRRSLADLAQRPTSSPSEARRPRNRKAG